MKYIYIYTRTADLLNEPFCYIYYSVRTNRCIEVCSTHRHKARHSAVTKSVKCLYEISTKRYHLPVALIVRRVLRELYYQRTIRNRFTKAPEQLPYRRLLSALRLPLVRGHSLVIIVFKRTEKFVVKVDGESPPPQALLNYSLTFPCQCSRDTLFLFFSPSFSSSLLLSVAAVVRLSYNNTIFARDLKLTGA